MHFLTELTALTALCGFLATSAASPAPAPAADASPAKDPLETRADVAVVNVYTGETCGGWADTITTAEGHVCYEVSNVNSIAISEQYVFYVFHPSPFVL